MDEEINICSSEHQMDQFRRSFPAMAIPASQTAHLAFRTASLPNSPTLIRSLLWGRWDETR